MKKILLIDDDHSTISYLREWLEDQDHFKVTNITKAEDVIEALSNTHYDAIILDMMMPIPQLWTAIEKESSQNGLATGLILFQKIRSKLPSIPILINSAREIPFDLDKFSSAIRKPESLHVISNQLKELMNHEN